MAGIFIPFAQYNQDMTRSMTGLCQVYPSKQITVTLNNTTEDYVKTWVEATTKDSLNGMGAGSAMHADYGAIRNALYKAIYINVVDHGAEGSKTSTAPSLGDINFLSNEVLDGWVCHDVLALIPAEQGKKLIILQEHALSDRADRTGLAFSVENDEYEQFESDRSLFEFNAIIMYYTLHRVDPSSKSADTVPVVVDMPMGIYLPGETVKMNVKSTETYSARIHSRIASAEASIPESTDEPEKMNEEVVQMSNVLNAFAELTDELQTVINDNKDHLGYTWSDIKSALESIKNQSAVNVPYIKDGAWYLNGRRLGTAVEAGGGTEFDPGMLGGYVSKSDFDSLDYQNWSDHRNIKDRLNYFEAQITNIGFKLDDIDRILATSGGSTGGSGGTVSGIEIIDSETLRKLFSE